MDVIITVTHELAGTLIRVDGWLAGAGVAELVRVFNDATSPVRLVVRDLRGADATGLSVLRRIAEQGTPLEGVSPYLDLLLAGPAGGGVFDARSPVRPETPTGPVSHPACGGPIGPQERAVEPLPRSTKT